MVKGAPLSPNHFKANEKFRRKEWPHHYYVYYDENHNLKDYHDDHKDADGYVPFDHNVCLLNTLNDLFLAISNNDCKSAHEEIRNQIIQTKQLVEKCITKKETE
jgi:hypothetical protein